MQHANLCLRLVVAFGLISWSACTVSNPSSDDDAGADAGFDSGAANDAGTTIDGSSGHDAHVEIDSGPRDDARVPTDAGATCGEVSCARGTVCCHSECSLCAPPDECVACPDPGATPDGGTPCHAVSGDCPEGFRCNFGSTAACLASPGPVGTCEPLREICPPVASVVCGCDGNEYTGACEAPVDIAYDGPCR
jgi:hypothetical protein